MATIIGNNLPPLPPGFVIGDLPAQQPQQPVQPPTSLADRIAESLATRGQPSVPVPVQEAVQDAIPPLPPGFVVDQQPTQEAVPQDSGFFERTGQALKERGANLADIFAAKQSTPEDIFQTIGTEIGAVGDIIGQGIVSAAKALPDAVKEPVVAAASTLLATDIGKAGMEALGEGVEAWESFKEENPRAARNIEATFNVGTAATPIKGVSAARIAGRGAGAAGRLAGRGIKEVGRGAQKSLARVPIVTSDDISTLASNAYKQADELGGTLKPKIADNFLGEINKIKPQTKLGKAIAGDTEFSRVVDRLDVLRNKPITLAAAQEIDEAIGNSIDNFFKEGRLTKEGKKLLDIQNSFRDSIEKASIGDITGGKEGFDALKRARKLWAGSRRLSDIERIIQRAELMEQPATGIRSGFRTLLNNPKRIKGFSPKERKLIRKAAQVGIVPNALRTAGSRLVPIVAGASTLDPIFAGTAFGASQAARGAAGAIQKRAARKVGKEVARGVLE